MRPAPAAASAAAAAVRGALASPCPQARPLFRSACYCRGPCHCRSCFRRSRRPRQYRRHLSHHRRPPSSERREALWRPRCRIRRPELLSVRMPRRARGARAVQHPAPSSRPVEFLRALRDRAPPDYAPSHTALRVCPLRRSNSRGWRSSYGTVPCNPVPARRCRCRLPAGALQNVRPAS